jgi:hypothetical protein
MLIKRLALIKYLYSIGLEQSRQVETIASFSILSFQDSIEMFLKLIAEHKNIKSEKFNFLDYWVHIPELTLLESMRNLNARRVNIKHKGLLPSKSDIEISRVNTTDFFDQNVIIQCGIDFKEISLLSLISYENVRLLLDDAQKALNISQNETCIEKVAFAFYELLNTYEKSKLNTFRHSPFFIGKSLNFNKSFHREYVDKKMEDFFINVKESIEEMQKAIKIISFGIDYKRFVKFKTLTPNIIKSTDGILIGGSRFKKKWTKENCQYCIDFVLESSLKLQEFDFDNTDLEEPIFNNVRIFKQ